MNTPNNTYWTTKDGRKLLIADMDLDHVIKCVKLLERSYGRSNRNNLEPREQLCSILAFVDQHIILAELTNPNQ